MIFTDCAVDIVRKYPNHPIKSLPKGENHPSEFIVVLEPTAKHPEWSMAVSYVQFSQPHYHQSMRELYVVEQGEIALCIGGGTYRMGAGSWHVVPENIVHSMHITEKCMYAIVRIYSSPGWTSQDHHLVFAPK